VNSYKNARLGFTGRVQLVHRVVVDEWTAPQTAASFGVSVRTVWKWVRRWRSESRAGLHDRSSRPALERRIAQLCARRLSGPQIADRLALPLSTVGDALRRLGLGRLPPLSPRPPIVRYERERPGELLHIDTKRLARIHPGIVGHRITGDRRTRGPRHTGWEYLHIAIDDASRVAYAEVLPDERAPSVALFLQRAVSWYAHLGVTIERVMTDNAFAYTQRTYARLVAGLGLRHLRTRPYTPRTNGKAERFIQTALREWAYVRPYRSSQQRTGALDRFLSTYNTTRPHTAHGRRPPITRLQP